MRRRIEFVGTFWRSTKDICAHILGYGSWELFSRQNEDGVEKISRGIFWLYMAGKDASGEDLRTMSRHICFRPSISDGRAKVRGYQAKYNLLRRTYLTERVRRTLWFWKSGRRKFSRHPPINFRNVSKWINPIILKRISAIQEMLAKIAGYAVKGPRRSYRIDSMDNIKTSSRHSRKRPMVMWSYITCLAQAKQARSLSKIRAAKRNLYRKILQRTERIPLLYSLPLRRGKSISRPCFKAGGVDIRPGKYRPFPIAYSTIRRVDKGAILD